MSNVNKLSVKQFSNPEHSVQHKLLEKIALELNRAAVLVVLESTTASASARITQYRVVSSHLLSAVNSLFSILKLTDTLGLQVREAIALTRVFYETCLVGSYCALDKGERAKRAELYSVFKTFKSQTKHRKIGPYEIRISRSLNLDRQNPLVREALSLFSGKNRSRSAFKEGREDMIIELNSKTPAAGVLFSGVEGVIYDISSEIIHGTHYSYDLFNRIQNGDRDQEDNIMAHYDSVYISICCSIAGFCKVINETICPADQIEALSELALDAVKPLALNSK